MSQILILLFSCLKVGMNPELVDASLRLKNVKKNKINYDQPTLINSLEPLENCGIVSDVLRVKMKTIF